MPGAALSRSLPSPRLVPRPENGKPAAQFPGGPGQRQPARALSAMPPQLTPLDGAVRYPGRRERGGQHRARRGHRGAAGTTGSDEQARFPALHRDRHSSSGHPLPDMPPHPRLPAREGQRCPDRALPPGPPRNTRPSLLPVASHTDRPPAARTAARHGPAGPAGPRHRPQRSPAAANPPGGHPRYPPRRGEASCRGNQLGCAHQADLVHQIASRPCRETSGSAC